MSRPIWNARITRKRDRLKIRSSSIKYMCAYTCSSMCIYQVKYGIFIWASSRENLSSGFQTKRLSNQSLQLQRLARKLILLDKRITKVLISLRGCAGWSAPVLFPNPQRQVFSRQGLYVAEN